MCLFSKSLPIRGVCRVWDIIFLEGRCAIFAIFIAFMALNESIFTEHIGQNGNVTSSVDEQSFLNKFSKAQVHTVSHQTEIFLLKVKGYLDSQVISEKVVDELSVAAAEKLKIKYTLRGAGATQSSVN